MASIIDRMRYHADHHALLLTQAELLRWITLLGDLWGCREYYDGGRIAAPDVQWDALFVDYQQEVDDA